mgnify:CR=1 FL=1
MSEADEIGYAKRALRAELKRERLVAVARGIEFLALGAVLIKPAGVMHRHALSLGGDVAGAFDHVIDDEAAGGGGCHDDPFFSGWGGRIIAVAVRPLTVRA